MHTLSSRLRYLVKQGEEPSRTRHAKLLAPLSPEPNPKPKKGGPLTIRIGFGAYHTTIIMNPQNSIGNYLGPYSTPSCFAVAVHCTNRPEIGSAPSFKAWAAD